MDYDLVVIGGGPGGYVAAIRAGQLDRDVLVVDETGNLGGVCLNWGCIPTKALLHRAEQYEELQDADRYGFEFEELQVNWEQLIKSSRRPVNQLGKGVEGLFKKNGVDYVDDHGKLVGPNTVQTGEGEQYEAGSVLLAAGARPRSFPGIEPNGDRIITSREAMMLKERPDRLVILGAGAIGVEFAYFYSVFGTEVTLVEMEDQLLPSEDPEVAEELEASFERSGINVSTGTRVKSVDQEQNTVTIETAGEDALEADTALVALGLEPNTDDLWDEDLNLRTDSDGWIDVKDDYSTSLPGVYAIGDVIGPPWLAHVASHEGIKMVEGAFTEEPVEPIDYGAIPACTYCQPQVASLGLTESEARDEYDRVRVGQFPFRAIGRAVAVNEKEGFVKLVFAGEFDELVGAHLIGRNATELITELGLAERLEATPEEIAETIHPHPTFSEAVMEAALDAQDRAIHF